MANNGGAASELKSISDWSEVRETPQCEMQAGAYHR